MLEENCNNMGTVSFKDNKKKCIRPKPRKKKEFSCPDNKKANIGKYLLECCTFHEKKLVDNWTKLLKDYKSKNPVEELLKDNKNCRFLTKYIRLGIPMTMRWQT